jgi:hypothetical protein
MFLYLIFCFAILKLSMKKVNPLRAAGILSFSAALFQLVISFSSDWSLYFGAPDELVNNFPLLLFSGVIASLIFILFGLYAFSGAGDLPAFPWLRTMLLSIASLFTLRGLLLIFQLLIISGITNSELEVPAQLFFTSAASLITGIVYFYGIRSNRARLKRQL